MQVLLLADNEFVDLRKNEEVRRGKIILSLNLDEKKKVKSLTIA